MRALRLALALVVVCSALVDFLVFGGNGSKALHVVIVAGGMSILPLMWLESWTNQSRREHHA